MINNIPRILWIVAYENHSTFEGFRTKKEAVKCIKNNPFSQLIGPIKFSKQKSLKVKEVNRKLYRVDYSNAGLGDIGD